VSDYDNSPVPFKATWYEYEVAFGTVMDRKCISWSHRVRCDDFEDVVALCEMWREARDYPAFEIEIDYLPHRLPEEAETGP